MGWLRLAAGNLGMKLVKNIALWAIVGFAALYFVITADDPWKVITFILGGVLVLWVLRDIEATGRRHDDEISELRGKVRGLEARISRQERHP